MIKGFSMVRVKYNASIGFKHVFFMHLHLPGPEGDVKNQGQSRRFSAFPIS